MSNKNCPTGACPFVDKNGAESDPGSDNTSRTGRTGGSERSGRSGRKHKSGGSERSGKSGRTHKSGDSGKSGKSGTKHSEKKDEHFEGGDAGARASLARNFPAGRA
jgi:hypothetical protein